MCNKKNSQVGCLNLDSKKVPIEAVLPTWSMLYHPYNKWRQQFYLILEDFPLHIFISIFLFLNCFLGKNIVIICKQFRN